MALPLDVYFPPESAFELFCIEERRIMDYFRQPSCEQELYLRWEELNPMEQLYYYEEAEEALTRWNYDMQQLWEDANMENENMENENMENENMEDTETVWGDTQYGSEDEDGDFFHQLPEDLQYMIYKKCYSLPPSPENQEATYQLHWRVTFVEALEEIKEVGCCPECGQDMPAVIYSALGRLCSDCEEYMTFAQQLEWEEAEALAPMVEIDYGLLPLAMDYNLDWPDL
jgi:hypothetical protein